MAKKIFTEKEKQEIIYEYTINKVGSKALGTKYGCSNVTLLKNLKEWGVQPNSKKIDLKDKSFGELFVLKEAPSQGDKYTRWICKCSCGKEVVVRTDYLRNGHTQSCGHIKNKYFGKKDLIGQRFGKLIVFDDVPPNSKKCKCDCGNIVIVKTDNLSSGNTQSCGCLKSKGEFKLNTILTNLKIDFKTQYSFEDCRFKDTNRLAYFDYAIFIDNKLLCLIEYDGQQHDYGWGQEENSLKIIKTKDEYKNQYCKDNNIKLFRINWKDYDKVNELYILKILEEAQEA